MWINKWIFSICVLRLTQRQKKKTTTTNSEEIQTPLNDATDLAEKHFKNAQLGFWKSKKIVNDALIKMMMDCLQAVRLVYVK